LSEVKCVWPLGATLGEGPVWVAREKALYFVDIKGCTVYRYDPATGSQSSWLMPEPIGACHPASDARFLCAFKSGFAFVSFGDELQIEPLIEPLGGPEADMPGNRFNDAKVDAAGRFWAGSMDDTEAEATGALYRMGSDLAWTVMDAGYVVTNGPAFSVDGRTLYHTDTFKRTIYAFDLAEDGALSNKREHIRIADDQGYPDGMTVDAEGYLWVAHWGGWRLTRFTPDGAVDRVVPVPAAQVTSCCFAGKDLATLYITTAAIGLSDDERAAQPDAGGLFRFQPGCVGRPGGVFSV
jgi:xylono-1,5-lactonase